MPENAKAPENRGFGNFENWSGRRDSNPRPQPWQGCALPLSYARSALTPKPRPAEVRRAPSMAACAPARELRGRLWRSPQPPIWSRLAALKESFRLGDPGIE